MGPGVCGTCGVPNVCAGAPPPVERIEYAPHGIFARACTLHAMPCMRSILDIAEIMGAAGLQYEEAT